jgi:FkbM family methyltransferase
MLSNRLNDSLKLQIRSALARLGVEISAYTGSFQDHRRALLERGRVETVWDVGAHVGQYASGLRRQGYKNLILSLEPARDAYWELSKRAAADARWRTLNVAAGAKSTVATLNLSANGQSSSVLPILDRHVSADPNSRYVGSQEVQIRTLDELYAELGGGRCALKLDVQGYELSALAGGQTFLDKCVACEVELSFAPLYQGGSGWMDVVQELAGHGLALCDIERVFYDRGTGDLMQVDGLFWRDDA